MSEILQSTSDIPFEDSIPVAGASLESILCTEELQRRPSRPPDYEKENRAFVALMSALADSPSTIFQTLADTILDITQCDSAGLSLLTEDGKSRTLAANDSTGQRSPACGIRTSAVGRRAISAPAETCLIKIALCCSDISSGVTPICCQSFPQPKSACWFRLTSAVKQSERSGGSCTAIVASSTQKTTGSWPRWGSLRLLRIKCLLHIDDLKIQIAEREKAEAEAHELARGLEAKMRRLVEANVVGIVLWNLGGAITGANEAFLSMVQYDLGRHRRRSRALDGPDASRMA